MKMNAETRKAWEECKIHWDKIAARDPDEEPGAHTCAFCIRFHEDDDHGDSTICVDPNTGEPCPVSRATGRAGCNGTPYEKAADEWSEDFEWRTGRTGTLYRELERDFIHSLGEAEDVTDWQEPWPEDPNAKGASTEVRIDPHGPEDVGC